MREGEKHKELSEFLLLLSVTEASCTLNSEECSAISPPLGTLRVSAPHL